MVKNLASGTTYFVIRDSYLSLLTNPMFV